MSIKFRTLPKAVIALVAVGLLFLWLTFLVGPLYNIVTNKLAYGRVVLASTSESTVLIDNKFYPFVNTCATSRDDSCEYEEGKEAFFLVSSPTKIGFRLDEILKQIGIGLLGTLILAAVCFEVRIKKAPTQAPIRHYKPHPHDASAAATEHQPHNDTPPPSPTQVV